MPVSLTFDAPTESPSWPSHDLADQRQLLDVGTESALADLWTRYGLTPAQTATRLDAFESHVFHNRPPAYRP